MFERKQIKANAKFVLKRSYSTALLTVLIAIIAVWAVNMAVNMAVIGATAGVDYYFGDIISQSDYRALLIIEPLMIITELALLLCVTAPVMIGLARFFIATREQRNPVEIRYALFGFRKGFLARSWALCSTLLIVALWSLLAMIPSVAGVILAELTGEEIWAALMLLSPFLMIPALIKSYQYRMVPFIIANNGEISGRRARELSGMMTDGSKWKLFVMDLSFIGWILLGLLFCGLGLIFVYPYILAAYAEAYTCLKAETIQTKNAEISGELPSMIEAEY